MRGQNSNKKTRATMVQRKDMHFQFYIQLWPGTGLGDGVAGRIPQNVLCMFEVYAGRHDEPIPKMQFYMIDLLMANGSYMFDFMSRFLHTRIVNLIDLGH